MKEKAEDLFFLPKISYFVHRVCTPEWIIARQLIDFHDLTYVAAGQGEYIIDDVAHPVSQGDLIYIKPGTWREASTSAGQPMQLYAFNMGIQDSACNPAVLLADEPTTALDVTIQAQILDLLMRLQAEHGMGLIMITHNMGVVAETADRVVVQYKGRKMEEADVLSLFETPRSNYTRALLSALPENAVGDRLPTVTDMMFEPAPGIVR